MAGDGDPRERPGLLFGLSPWRRMLRARFQPRRLSHGVVSRSGALRRSVDPRRQPQGRRRLSGRVRIESIPRRLHRMGRTGSSGGDGRAGDGRCAGADLYRPVDPHSPTPVAEEAASKLSRAYVVEIPGQGHNVLGPATVVFPSGTHGSQIPSRRRTQRAAWPRCRCPSQQDRHRHVVGCGRGGRCSEASPSHEQGGSE